MINLIVTVIHLYKLLRIMIKATGTRIQESNKSRGYDHVIYT